MRHMVCGDAGAAVDREIDAVAVVDEVGIGDGEVVEVGGIAVVMEADVRARERHVVDGHAIQAGMGGNAIVPRPRRRRSGYP